MMKNSRLTLDWKLQAGCSYGRRPIFGLVGYAD